ncbi:MAG: hypothetical protein QNJ09_09440 [Paracoccaceae bacterium]|nr:hypothetical protein [Paracoccaceae bacterium]
MNSIHYQASPTGWGQDRLTQYLDDYRGNQHATFANKRSEVIDLIAIDSMFCKLLDGATNPQPFIPMSFLLRAHAAYRGATGAIMAGQLYEAQALLRLCLEQGAYAHYIGDDQTRWTVWMNRHDNDAAKKAVRDEFTHGKVSRHITAANVKLGKNYTTLYERTIDYGAHPNERGASLSSETVEMEDGGEQLHTIYLHCDGVLLDYSLKSAAQVGLWVLKIGQEIYPTRIQALGLQHQIADMSKRF